MATTSEYEKKIWMYEKRREASRATVRRLNYKIREMKNLLDSRRSYEKERDRNIDRLINAINDYFLVDIKSQVNDKEHTLARKIYCKIAVESGFEVIHIGKKINKTRKYAYYHRDLFTKSFHKNELNKEIFHNFKNYFKNIKS